MNNDNSNSSTTSRPAKSVDFERMPLPPAKPADSRTGSDLSRFNTPLRPAGYEQPRPVGKNGAPAWFRDVTSIVMFIVVVAIGVWVINSFVFLSFNVVGPSMEPTLEGEGVSDRLIVNRMPLTAATLTGKTYLPERGNIIVFKNPLRDNSSGGRDEYIVKRVIALPGERVTVHGCTLLVYNHDHSGGFNPYDTFKNLASDDKQINTCVDGEGTDVTVPKGRVFVTGDHRVGNYSMDSRNGDNRATLGTIPLEDIVGPVAMRIWPLNSIKFF